jgi:hypothetical protein
MAKKYLPMEWDGVSLGVENRDVVENAYKLMRIDKELSELVDAKLQNLQYDFEFEDIVNIFKSVQDIYSLYKVDANTREQFDRDIVMNISKYLVNILKLIENSEIEDEEKNKNIGKIFNTCVYFRTYLKQNNSENEMLLLNVSVDLNIMKLFRKYEMNNNSEYVDFDALRDWLFEELSCEDEEKFTGEDIYGRHKKENIEILKINIEESTEKILEMLQNTENLSKQQELSQLLYAINDEFVQIDDEGVQFLGNKYDLGEFNSKNNKVKCLDDNGLIGIFDENDELKYCFSNEESLSGIVKKPIIFDFVKEYITTDYKKISLFDREVVADFARNYKDFYDKTKKQYDIGLNQLDIITHITFYEYTKENIDDERLFKCIKKYGDIFIESFCQLRQFDGKSQEVLLNVVDNIDSIDEKINDELLSNIDLNNFEDNIFNISSSLNKKHDLEEFEDEQLQNIVIFLKTINDYIESDIPDKDKNLFDVIQKESINFRMNAEMVNVVENIVDYFYKEEIFEKINEIDVNRIEEVIDYLLFTDSNEENDNSLAVGKIKECIYRNLNIREEIKKILASDTIEDTAEIGHIFEDESSFGDLKLVEDIMYNKIYSMLFEYIENNNLEKIEKYNFDVELVRTVFFVSRRLNMDEVSFDELEYMQVHTKNGFELDDNIIDEMKFIISSNYKEYPEEFQSMLRTDFEERLKNPNTQFRIIEYKDNKLKSVVAFFTETVLKDGSLYLGNFNLNKGMFAGAEFGREMYTQIVERYIKEGKMLKAHCDHTKPITQTYIESGFGARQLISVNGVDGLVLTTADVQNSNLKHKSAFDILSYKIKETDNYIIRQKRNNEKFEEFEKGFTLVRYFQSDMQDKEIIMVFERI